MLIQKSGENTLVYRDNSSIFEMAQATNELVDSFVQKGALTAQTIASPSLSNEQASIEDSNTGQASAGASTSPITLPAIEPWAKQSDFLHFQASFDSAIKNLAISLSISFVTVGAWQMYREAAYRTASFSTMTTVSGAVAIASVAVTTFFTVKAVVNTRKIVQSTH